MTIEEYFGDWCKVIDTSKANSLIKQLATSGQSICPKVKDIFKAFTLCSLHDVKVVMLGQDPYADIQDGEPRATGIAFGNTSNTPENSYSPSLDVLMRSVIDFSYPHECINFDPSLEKWEQQGVLMLNSALSCQAWKIGSHSLMWRPFISDFLAKLSAYDTGIVYVLMGTEAQSFEPYINSRYNHIIRIKHPSWYARNKIPMPSNLWKEINSLLIGKYGFGINWYNELNI